MHPRSLFTRLVCTRLWTGKSMGLALEYGDEGEASAEFIVEDVSFIAIHSSPESTAFLLLCDFGEIAQAHAEAIYRTVLEANLAAIQSDRGTFCVTPEGSRLLLATKGRLDSIDAESLANAMHRMATHAIAWRDQHMGMSRPQRGLPANALSILA
jgi:hypothetical protein